jgi:hypothetical protein
MAAIAWSVVADGIDVYGRRRNAMWTMTLSATAYAAGGYAVTGATFGLKGIAGMIQISGVPASTTSDLLFKYNSSTGKVQAFGSGASDTAVLVEVANGNLTLTVLFLVISISD